MLEIRNLPYSGRLGYLTLPFLHYRPYIEDGHVSRVEDYQRHSESLHFFFSSLQRKGGPHGDTAGSCFSLMQTEGRVSMLLQHTSDW